MDGPNIMQKVFAQNSNPLANNIIHLRRKGIKHIYGPTLQTMRRTPSMDDLNIMEEIYT